MEIENKITSGMTCPAPIRDYKQILLSHGGGGSLSHQLINEIFVKVFDNPALNLQHDGAILDINGTKLAFTTDSYVINPIFFPGGDIGSLSVYGTVNDLAMCGAKPLFISAGFIIEEGFPIEELWEISNSMKQAADNAGVQIVTGDTKVVEKGKGDKLFINTAGIGLIDKNDSISPKNCKPGDVIIINGSIAEHGIAILSKREGFEFESEIISDCCPLNGLVQEILSVSKNVHTMRDPTRGGVASVLNEIAMSSNLGIVIEENKIPINDNVKSACEILGFDALYVANEGKVLIFVTPDDAEKVLQVMKNHPYGKDASIIGKVVDDNPGLVRMKTSIGSMRIVDMLSGEQLPRIC
ncbi:MAG: hydrogenase expression/formation protein HypE [Ignavibacteria bacterium GWB2_35_12]|nr:MAG: hydrogenase expression/formation protein HypE [Ignavibacteria bacterium GWA2_35_8]OGU39655.1 MAG: hydrogenase expression/formation protein HypE [Ignavibacteria bacterium GWB2_35_12]OGU93584.1 MAG: hydrogenase expression/formation protein HypE [Ignavibacteria bacterium RIFOXYA2_FULL_35_10]OGV23849.1 MAG: hydrogenase expression/formation protein HypE [Ignavibacteria bacterium RIFOXYC2_FULL_35_21]